MVGEAIEVGYHFVGDENRPAPEYGTPDSAGFDLTASVDCVIRPQSYAVIPLGLVVGLPRGYHLEIVPRSSLWKHKKCILTNSVGVIDSDFCGAEDTIVACLRNMSDEAVVIYRGERILQGILRRTIRAEFTRFQPEAKSRGGVGSTGGYEKLSRS